MIKVCGILAFTIVAGAALASPGQAQPAGRSISRICTGMELTQSVSPDDAAPDARQDAQPDDGSADGNSQAPGDDGAGDADDGDQASPPDTAEPPGCIFREGPLELLV